MDGTTEAMLDAFNAGMPVEEFLKFVRQGFDATDLLEAYKVGCNLYQYTFCIEHNEDSHLIAMCRSVLPWEHPVVKAWRNGGVPVKVWNAHTARLGDHYGESAYFHRDGEYWCHEPF
jgi:hypothetical protein